jgi:serine/threonine protein kinase/predicted Zn-dependent protease
MSPERWVRVKSLFDRVVELPLGERDQVVSASEESVETINEVRRLLANIEAASDFMREPLSIAAGFRTYSTADLAYTEGTVLAGRFRIIRYLACGGMGEVYEAFDEILSQRIALKTLRIARIDSPDFHARFVHEVQTARSVTHPNVCRVYDLEVHEGTPFITMELLCGETLASYLKRTAPIKEVDALPLIQQVCNGLEAAHLAGIVHRDLKPGNIILVTTDGAVRAVITDFGLARFSEPSNTSGHSSTQFLAGTPDYIAPEVLAGQPATARADIFSFGVILFEMLTGRRPFSSHVRGIVERVSGRAPSPREIIPTISPNWDKTIRQCLDRDPAQRPRSASIIPKHLRRRPALSFSRRKWLPIAAAGCCGTLVLPRLLHRGFGAVPAGARVMVADVLNTTGDQRLSSLTDLLRAQLLESSHLNPVEGSAIRGTLERMGRTADYVPTPADLHEISAREGVTLLVFSTVASLGRNFVLSIQLEKLSRSGSPVATAYQTYHAASLSDVFDVVRLASGWLRETSGESSRAVAESDIPPQDLTTNSWDALDEFSKAERLSASRRLGDAAVLLESAVRRDPDFSSAWARLGDISNSMHREMESLQYWKRALATIGRRRLARREELRILGMYAFDSGAIDESDRHFRAWSVEFPSDPLGHFYRSLPLAYSGRAQEAIDSLVQVQQSVGEKGWLRGTLAAVQLIANQPSASLETLQRPGSSPLRSNVDRLRAGALFTLGRFDQAIAVLDSMAKDGLPAGYYWKSVLLSEAGKFEAALETVRAGLRTTPHTDEEPVRNDMTVFAAALELRVGNKASARAIAGDFLRDGNAGASRETHAAITLIRSGETGSVAPLMKKFADHSDVNKCRFGALRIQGEALLAKGRSTEAVQFFETASPLQPKAWYRDYLAAALLAAGKLKESLGFWEAIVGAPGVIWTSQYPLPPGIGYDALISCREISKRIGRAESAEVSHRLFLYANWSL